MAATAATITAAGATTTSSSPESRGADGRLVTRAASARISSLFREEARLVLRICRAMLRDPVEAEDAAQQTFLSAYGSLLTGRVPRDEVAWLATIARNECRARIRARMCEPLAELDEDSSVAPDDVHEIAIRRSEVAALRRALVELPSQQRRAFVLREFGGLSYEELAESLSVSLGSVESLLFRARRGLRARLEPAFAGVNGALSVPFMLRDWLLRLATGGGESAGAAAKIASLPVVAKLAAAGAGAALVAGGAVGLEAKHATRPVRHVQAARPVLAPVVKKVVAPRPAAGPTAVPATHVIPVSRAVVQKPKVVHAAARVQHRPAAVAVDHSGTRGSPATRHSGGGDGHSGRGPGSGDGKTDGSNGDSGDDGAVVIGNVPTTDGPPPVVPEVDGTDGSPAPGGGEGTDSPGPGSDGESSDSSGSGDASSEEHSGDDGRSGSGSGDEHSGSGSGDDGSDSSGSGSGD
jgi:RNA polymerase sigma-70 factor (ECF subfamily)